MNSEPSGAYVVLVSIRIVIKRASVACGVLLQVAAFMAAKGAGRACARAVCGESWRATALQAFCPFRFTFLTAPLQALKAL